MVAYKTEVDTSSERIVLIISEDRDSASMWEKLFLQKGCSVVREAAPRHALRAIKLASPSLILLNIDMPHTERVDLCRSLRAITKSIILILSPTQDEQEIYEYYLAGVDEHLVTPLNPMILLIKSMAWLVKHDWLDTQIQPKGIYI